MVISFCSIHLIPSTVGLDTVVHSKEINAPFRKALLGLKDGLLQLTHGLTKASLAYSASFSQATERLSQNRQGGQHLKNNTKGSRLLDSTCIHHIYTQIYAFPERKEMGLVDSSAPLSQSLEYHWLIKVAFPVSPPLYCSLPCMSMHPKFIHPF